METKAAAKQSATSLEHVSKLSLATLGDGSYLIARVAVPTERRTFTKDGKPSVLFVTTLHADGGLYEISQFANPLNESETERHEPIVQLKIGERVLFRRSPPMRDKASGRTQVEKLYGKVLDAQSA